MDHKKNIEFPEQLKGKPLPDVLLPYQKELMSTTAVNQVILVPKSRRIGVTWGIGADAVLHAASNKAAGGMDVFYIGYNFDMAREFIDVCAMWAKAFNHAVSNVEEWVFEEKDEDGTKHAIKAFRITFDSGFEISALSSKPRSLRGRQGYIIIDEAAFHDDLQELMKAALAMLIWGGKVLVISTHDGVDNYFNEMIQAAHSGKNKYEVFQVDFDEALKDGLYKRICLVTGKNWSVKAEKAWRQEIVDFYGEGADEELFCIPKRSSGTFLPGLLIENAMIDVPVIRYEAKDNFVYKPDYERERIIADWCEEVLKPILNDLDPQHCSYLGEDFGRSGDLTTLHPLQVLQDLTRYTPFTVELRNVPFAQQRQIVWYIIDRLPKFSGAAFDARGNGQQLAEETMQRYGAHRIHQIMLSQAFYLDCFPKYKAGLEDGLMTLPRDKDVLDDHRAAKVVSGIPQIPNTRTKGADGGKRHGDSLISAALAYWVTLQEVVEYGYHAVGRNMEPQSSLRRDDDFYSRFKGGAW